MRRIYSHLAWTELLKMRDALEVLRDNCYLATLKEFHDEQDMISEEIDYRYKHGTTKGE